MAKCGTCIHNYEGNFDCRKCHDMDKYVFIYTQDEEDTTNGKYEESGIDNKDVDKIVINYEILINKYEEAFELYGKIIDEYKKHIELLKEKVRLLEKLNNLNTSRIEELKKHI